MAVPTGPLVEGNGAPVVGADGDGAGLAGAGTLVAVGEAEPDALVPPPDEPGSALSAVSVTNGSP
jgi:hypothetical protein